ncbi:hypothetical protein [Roseibacillus persicicus]|uniref:hypothetical protein n=1 Tax=Roseibacillus persicicus TaxID=454148 RepID=UPI00280EC081|nr:hypothetical protein [Roseibacillus persicicus]MDQ8190952.1 hypothetical protein [Roseibacillus persicicus]
MISKPHSAWSTPLHYLALTSLGITPLVAGPIVMTGTGSYSQDFNSLPASGATRWNDDSTLEGWYADRRTSPFDLFSGTGSSNSPQFYNFGTSQSTDRALGSVASTSAGSHAYGVLFQNNSGTTLVINSVSYTGEQWRNGGNDTAQTLEFSYYRNYNIINTADYANELPFGWISHQGLSFTSPIAVANTLTLDGNADENRTEISSNPGISVADGEYVMLRWIDVNDSGNDHGLAIDDLHVTWIDEAAVDDDYNVWAAATGAVQGEDGDDDGDGLLNSYEYAFGLNPLSADSPSPMTTALSRTDGTFHFTRRTQTLTNLTYTVYTSTTLEEGDWTADPGATLAVVSSQDDIEEVEVTLSGELPLEQSELFVRVVAE